MKPGSEDLVDELTAAQGARSVCTTAAVALAAAVLPELEDVNVLALAAGAAALLGFAVSALGGAAWAFDASDLPAARARAGRAWTTASSAALLFCAALLTQVGLAPEGGAAWAYLAAPVLAWLGWVDFPWTALEALGARRRGKPPGPERYEAAAAPAPERTPAALPPDVEALFVGSGSFRVDRARMVEVLSRFQTGDPEAFLLPWLRLAVASDAARLELTLREGGLELHFDGRPLSPRHCSDPFEALVGEEDPSGEGQRHRHLSWGLLNLLPLSPRVVLGRSGEARLRVEPKGAAKTHWVDPEPRLGTALRVLFDGLDADPRAARCVARARQAWGAADAELRVDGQAVPAWEPRTGVGTRFSSAGVRGVFYREEDETGIHRPRLFWHGAFLCEDASLALPAGWCARWTFAGLTADASLKKALDNEAYRAAAKAARAEFDRLSAAGALGAGVLRSPAYTKAGLAAALAGGALSFAAFIAADSARPDLAWAAGAAYVVTTTAMLALLGRWALARLSGRLNPFRG